MKWDNDLPMWEDMWDDEDLTFWDEELAVWDDTVILNDSQESYNRKNENGYFTEREFQQ